MRTEETLNLDAALVSPGVRRYPTLVTGVPARKWCVFRYTGSIKNGFAVTDDPSDDWNWCLDSSCRDAVSRSFCPTVVYYQ